MKLDEMKRIKEEHHLTYEMVADMAGVPLSTVQKLFGGQTKMPRYDTLYALEKFFVSIDMPTEEMVEECSTPYQIYKKPGEYTLEDYYEIPDDQRVELIDGVFYAMSSPRMTHQMIAGEVHYQIMDYVRRKKGKCTAFSAPADVQLDCDDRTMVQPDVMIICDKNKVGRSHVMGAPDWIMEVLSPSTKKKDCIKKLNKYLDAGVREFWIADPETNSIIVYDFANNQFPTYYTFKDEIPVGIYDGELKISLKYILEDLDSIKIDEEE